MAIASNDAALVASASGCLPDADHPDPGATYRRRIANELFAWRPGEPERFGVDLNQSLFKKLGSFLKNTRL